MALHAQGVKPKRTRKSFKRLRLDLKAAFVAAAKGVINAVAGKPDEMAANAVEMLGTVRLDPRRPEEAAQKLNTAALAAALEEIGRQALDDPGADREKFANLGLVSAIVDSVVEGAADIEWEMDAGFLATPRNAVFLPEVEVRVSEWLFRLGISRAAATSIASRVPTYFVYALHNAWASHADVYASLHSAIHTPFEPAAEQEQAWERHTASIARLIEEPLYGTPYTLKQLYEPLYALVEFDAPESGRREEKRKTIAMLAGGEAIRLRGVALAEKDLDDWTEGRGNCSSAIRVLSGGPGSGKSSLLRTWAVNRANKGHRVLYVPLHHLIGLESDIGRVLGGYFEDRGFKLNPLSHGELSGDRPITVVLDGLDEIAMEGKAATAAAAAFAEWIDRLEGRLNYQCDPRSPRVRFLIGGREIVIQQCASVFRQAGQVLSILSYSLFKVFQDRTETQRIDEKAYTSRGLTKEKPDQRGGWWRRFGAVSGASYSGLPAELRDDKFADVTSQPLLNFLLAHRYQRAAAEGILGALNDRVSLYEQLLSDVLERRWDRARNPGTEGIENVQQFTRILEEIALATWHGDGRSASLKMIEEYCRTAHLEAWLRSFESASRGGLASFVVSFYFRQTRTSGGEATIEFTHKSFAEFLVARRAVQILAEISDDIRPRSGRPPSLGEVEALAHWTDEIGLGQIGDDLHPWFEGVAERYRDRSRDLHATAVSLLSLAVNDGLEVRRCLRAPGTPAAQARFFVTAESILMLLRSLFARLADERSRIAWPGPSGFSFWVHKALSLDHDLGRLTQGHGIRRYLDRFDLAGQDLPNGSSERQSHQSADFTGLDLSGGNLSHWVADRVSFKNCTLCSVNLSAMKAIQMKLIRCLGDGVDLSRSKLSEGFFTASSTLPFLTLVGSEVGAIVVGTAHGTEDAILITRGDSTAVSANDAPTSSNRPSNLALISGCLFGADLAEMTVRREAVFAQADLRHVVIPIQWSPVLHIVGCLVDEGLDAILKGEEMRKRRRLVLYPDPKVAGFIYHYLPSEGLEAILKSKEMTRRRPALWMPTGKRSDPA